MPISVTRTSRILVMALAVAATGSLARADIRYLESGTSISFEGCDWDKLINLKNGYVWECSEYKYVYQYGPVTVLSVNGRSKLCLGDVEDAIEEFPDGNCFDGKLYNWK